MGEDVLTLSVLTPEGTPQRAVNYLHVVSVHSKHVRLEFTHMQAFMRCPSSPRRGL